MAEGPIGTETAISFVPGVSVRFRQPVSAISCPDEKIADIALHLPIPLPYRILQTGIRSTDQRRR
jgi:hypothetical protein